MKKIFFIFLLILPLSAACGDGKSGVKLFVTTGTTLAQPAAKPAGSKPFLAATGDQTGDGFDDQLITPSAVTVGLKSFRFFKANDPSVAGQPQEDYTVFGADDADPREIEFRTGVQEEIAETSREPREGTYDRIEYELTFLEMIIPLCRENDDCENRRLRFYFKGGINDPNLDITTTEHDLLLSRTENGFDFGWISPRLGISGSGTPQFLITAPRPTGNDAPLKVPAGQLTGATSSVFSLQLPTSLDVPKNPKGKYAFTLTFNLENIFFFDNTDKSTIDPTAPFHFNALLDDPLRTKDGTVALFCPSGTTTCTTSADFYPGLPAVTVSVIQEPEE